MSQTGTSAWWADVQHLRDAAEQTDEARRRAELVARRASRERRRSDEPQVAASRRWPDEPEPAPSRRRNQVDGSGLEALPAATTETSSRRTVKIRGRAVPAPAVSRTSDRRRPPRQAAERVGSQPDRLALWALLMGLVLILVAVSTADAAAVAAVASL